MRIAACSAERNTQRRYAAFACNSARNSFPKKINPNVSVGLSFRTLVSRRTNAENFCDRDQLLFDARIHYIQRVVQLCCEHVGERLLTARITLPFNVHTCCCIARVLRQPFQLSIISIRFSHMTSSITFRHRSITSAGIASW